MECSHPKIANAKCKFNIKHRVCLRNLPSQKLMTEVLTIQIKLEFENVAFLGKGRTGEPGEKPLGARKRTNNQLNPHMTPSQGIELGSHWWEASTLTTAPFLLPRLPSVSYVK